MHTKEWNEKISKSMMGKKNAVKPEVQKRAMHFRIEVLLGLPRYCEHCKSSTCKRYDWANKDHKYSSNLSDWMRLCRGCHLKYDFKYNNCRKHKSLPKKS